jgi:1-acyl-sn-glycerol-3-phosphate acyltransferase
MSRRNIRKFSPGFWLLLSASSIFHRLYYRKFIVKFRSNIPKNTPVIFAANHQNAFLDAVAIIFSTRSQIVFMARADIFKKKLIAGLLYFIKILPVYRIRDGFHSVDQNKEVFKEVISVLGNNNPTALFPEGSHLGEKRLRPFKKGAARLAMLAEEEIGDKHDVMIVPVGIDYSNYYHAGSDLLIVFGEPMSAAAYKDQFAENPAQALINFTDDIYTELNKVVINIDHEKHYKTLKEAIDLYCPVEINKQKLQPSLWNKFLIKRDLVKKILTGIDEKEPLVNDLKQEINSYNRILKAHKIRDHQIAHPLRNSASLILKSCLALILFPVHLYGMVLNYLPYRLPVYLGRNIKDPHFIGSVHFSAGLLFFLVYYPVIYIISFFIFSNVLLWLIFLISVPLTGIVAFYNYKFIQKLKAEFRWMMMKYRNRKVYEQLIVIRENIVIKIEELLSN